MTTETGAPAAAPAAAPAELPDELSLEDARSIIDGWSDDDLQKSQNVEGQEPEAEREQPAAAAKNTSQEENADPEADPGEQKTEQDDPEDENLPLIEPPRSWTKEAKDQWSALPRPTQEYLAQREQERDRGLRQSQNELAEQRKAFDAERKAVEQLKQQYEQRLPTLTKTLEQALQDEFADIKDFADVRKMQAEDPFRYQQWQLRQMEIAQAQKEQTEAETKRNQEQQASLAKFMSEQSQKFNEALSDKDRSNLKELMAAAPKFLEDRGFSEQELADLWQGKGALSLHDHRLQLLILDGMKFRDLQNAPKAVAAKTLPPVQKPGSAKQVSGIDAEIAALERKQELSEAEGFALLQMRDKARSRR